MGSFGDKFVAFDQKLKNMVSVGDRAKFKVSLGETEVLRVLHSVFLNNVFVFKAIRAAWKYCVLLAVKEQNLVILLMVKLEVIIVHHHE